MSPGTIEELSTLPDKIYEIDQQSVVINAVSDSTSEILKTLIKEVNELKLASNCDSDIVCVFSLNYNRSKQRSRSSLRTTFNKWKMGENNYCFYHDNFGKKAKKCVESYKYKESENQ